jgi:hypothetical protein
MAGVVTIVIAAVAFFSVSLSFYIRVQNTPEELRQMLQEQARRAARESREAIKARVGVGMTREYVEYALGAPDSTQEMRNDNAVLEIWDYECPDGHVQISILDGKVQGVRP